MRAHRAPWGWLVGLVALGCIRGAPVHALVTLTDLRARFLAQEAQAKTWSFTYDQEVTLESGGGTGPERTHFKGKAVVQRPRALWLRQTAPEEELIVSDGERVWMYTPRFHQVVVSSWTAAVQRMPLLTAVTGWGQAFAALEERYLVTLEPAMDGQYILRCRARQAQDTTRLRFWLAGRDLLPERSEVEDDGVRITVTFRGLKTTDAVDQQLFRFVPPPGVQVIDD